nr:lipase family protein [Nocardia brasiliensis]
MPVEPVRPLPALPPAPGFDPAFYRPAPDRYVELAPGELIAARAVQIATMSVAPLNVDAWQLSYRSNNSREEAIPAVATVLKPRGYVAGRPLLSFQIPEDSVGDYCAPSYVMQLGSVPGLLSGQPLVPAAMAELVAALQLGWAVVVSDHQGPDSAFAAGPLAGRITLDGIRAAENFEPLELDGTATKVGLMGYSGGSTPTGHAAELHRSYAPELDIVGVAEGGVSPDMRALVDLANGNLGAGIVLTGIIGVGREYPDFAQFLRERINPLGQVILGAKQDLCIAYQSALMPFLNIKGLTTTGADPVLDPVAVATFDKLRMGKSVPTMPMYIYHSNPDWLLPIGPVNTLVDEYCRDPAARVLYTRDHFSEHLTMDLVGAPGALLWLRDRFAGIPVAPGCVTNDVGSLLLDPITWQVWQSAVGANVAALFGQPIGR